MFWLIWLLALAWLAWLVWENRQNDRARTSLRHVVHVNGTRGKSTTSRLIEAGLRAGGLRVFCKTTGTDPMTIDVAGKEEPILRHGKANIKEQIQILKKAADQQADVLVIECMALLPELQYAAQHRILQADVGVITNVRRDHTDVMGETLPEICEVLSNTVPKNGMFFTGEENPALADQLRRKAESMGSEFYNPRPNGTEPPFDFAENIALALAVCERLGVDRETALVGMAAFKRDPYALGLYHIGGAEWVNGLSINDIQSTCMVWEQLKEKHHWQDKKMILLLNNRADRGSRTKDMLQLCFELNPHEVWLMGSNCWYLQQRIHRRKPTLPVTIWHKAEVDFARAGENTVVFAAGNIAGSGRELIARIREEGEEFV